MLSRRSVRIKVMQLLYAKSRDEALSCEDLNKLYWKGIDNSFDVFLFNFYNFVQVTKLSVDDAQKRKSKHLPSEEDKAFTAALCENPLIDSVRNNTKLIKLYEQKGFSSNVDRDIYKKIYFEFAKEEPYKDYILNTDKTRDDHVNILLELYRFCRRNELFGEIMEDNYLNWTDDKSLVIGSVKKVIKALPIEQDDNLSTYYPDDETVKEYGEALLDTTCRGESVLLGYIKPLLENWDPERLAVVDTILLQMAASEFVNFPTIPTKVTLNEYVEVSKLYSTDKSKEFVNGVLDKLMKKLEKEGKISKEGRGLVD